MEKKTVLGGAILLVFVLGIIYIVFQGRPVVQLQEELREIYEHQEAYDDEDMYDATAEESEEIGESGDATSSGTATLPKQAATPFEPDTSANAETSVAAPTDTTPAELAFTLATVAEHNTTSDCWSAINGSVYDLTSWVSRHPGGSGAIKRLCGTDGSQSYNRQHGRSGSAANALALLKIGSLK